MPVLMSRPYPIRPALLLLCALAISSEARAQTRTIDLETEQVEIVSHPGATAVFAVNATVATASIAGDRITIVGRSPGSTFVMIISGDRSESLQVSVRESEPVPASTRAMGSADSSGAAGTLETRYLSSPHILQSTVRLFQQRGTRTTELMVGGTKPLDDAPESVFNIPVASFSMRNRGDELTFFDRMVDNSPLTLSRVNVRGIHVRRGPWSVHGGYSFFSTFENLMLPAVREGVGGVGYRFQSGGRAVTPNLYYFHRDSAAGSGGLLSTVAFESRFSEGATLLTEVGVSRAVAAAAELDIRRGSQQLWARVRFVPADHPSLSVGYISGRAADVVWSRSAGRLTLGTNVSAHRTATATPHTTSTATLRVDYRLSPRWTVGTHPSYSFFRASQSPGFRIQRVSAPVNAGLSAGFLQALGDYELSRQTGSGRTAHSLQGALRKRFMPLHGSSARRMRRRSNRFLSRPHGCSR
jgi:hypothetical protein